MFSCSNLFLHYLNLLNSLIKFINSFLDLFFNIINDFLLVGILIWILVFKFFAQIFLFVSFVLLLGLVQLFLRFLDLDFLLSDILSNFVIWLTLKLIHGNWDLRSVLLAWIFARAVHFWWQHLFNVPDFGLKLQQLLVGWGSWVFVGVALRRRVVDWFVLRRVLQHIFVLSLSLADLHLLFGYIVS